MRSRYNQIQISLQSQNFITEPLTRYNYEYIGIYMKDYQRTKTFAKKMRIFSYLTTFFSKFRNFFASINYARGSKNNEKFHENNI